MYVRLSGRVRVNASALNSQGTVGNVIELTRVNILRRFNGEYELVEVPAVTGNMIKHWHFVHFINAYKNLQGNKLCEYCNRLIGYRSPDRNGKSERYFVEKCAGEDVHGFLQPDNQIRRDSLFKASFMIPVEDLETSFDVVTHNRIGVDEKGKIDKNIMMLFKRQYSSSLYGFLLILDLYYVGRLLYDSRNEVVVDNAEIKKRGKAALLALLPLLTGEVGAAKSRSQPIWKVEELVASCSNKYIPPLIHGHYSDYVEESARVLTTYSEISATKSKLYLYGIDEKRLNVVKKIVGSAKNRMVEITVAESWEKIIESLVREYESSSSSG